MTKRTRDDRGAAIVEFAIVLPILLMLLVGIIQFGMAYHTQISIQSAAREGARELALRRTSAEVNARVRAAAPSVTVKSPIGMTPCPSTGDGQASVVVTADVTFSIPFVPSPVGTKTLTATGVMRCGL